MTFMDNQDDGISRTTFVISSALILGTIFSGAVMAVCAGTERDCAIKNRSFAQPIHYDSSPVRTDDTASTTDLDLQ